MFPEDPPPTASAPNRRRTKFTTIVRTLVANPDKFYNITDDINDAGGEGKDGSYFGELARSITAGNRAAFSPRGAFEGRSEGTAIWAKYISPENRNIVAAEPAEPAEPEAGEDATATTDADSVNDRELEPA